MKIIVINETSAKEKNIDIVNAIKKAGGQPINAGMTNGENGVELTYIHTGFMAGVLMNLGVCDLIVGGCGTGQGFMLSAMQYPNVFCGHIIDPLEAWLFSQINGGNCISLALNKGYGWAGGINLEYIFEKLLKDISGTGYPVERQQSQRESREKLNKISISCHKSMEEIIANTEKDILATVFSHKPFVEIIKGEVKNKKLQKFIVDNYLVQI